MALLPFSSSKSKKINTSGFVQLQSVTPGVQQVGNTNIAGTNLMQGYFNYSAITFSGFLNDMSTAGIYAGAGNTTYEVKIDSIGTPDTYEWYKNGVLQASGIPIVAHVVLDLDQGTAIKFAFTTGHHLNDNWTFTAIALNPLLIKSVDGSYILKLFNDNTISILASIISPLLFPPSFQISSTIANPPTIVANPHNVGWGVTLNYGCVDGNGSYWNGYQNVIVIGHLDGTYDTISVPGFNLIACCFDGTNIWAVNYNTSTNNLLQIDALTRTVVNTYSVGSSGNLQDIAYDPNAGYLWVGSGGDNAVYKVDPANGNTLQTVSGQTNVNGTFLFTLSGVDYLGSCCQGFWKKIRLSDGAVIDTYSLGGDTQGYRGCWQTNTNNVMIVSFGGNAYFYDASLSSSNYALKRIFYFDSFMGGEWNSVKYDGQYFWIVGDNGGIATDILGSGPFPLIFGFTYIGGNGLAWDPINKVMWSANLGGNGLYAVSGPLSFDLLQLGTTIFPNTLIVDDAGNVRTSTTPTQSDPIPLTVPSGASDHFVWQNPIAFKQEVVITYVTDPSQTATVSVQNQSTMVGGPGTLEEQFPNFNITFTRHYTVPPLNYLRVQWSGMMGNGVTAYTLQC